MTLYIYVREGLPVISSADPQIEGAVVRTLSLPDGESLLFAMSQLQSLGNIMASLPPQVLATALFKIEVGE
jgi:hypothetical protein